MSDRPVDDAARNEAAELLQQYVTAGQLTNDQFNDRLSRALTASTASDLQALFADLPALDPTTQPMAQPSSTIPVQDPYGRPVVTYDPVSTPQGWPTLPQDTPTGAIEPWQEPAAPTRRSQQGTAVANVTSLASWFAVAVVFMVIFAGNGMDMWWMFMLLMMFSGPIRRMFRR